MESLKVIVVKKRYKETCEAINLPIRGKLSKNTLGKLCKNGQKNINLHIFTPGVSPCPAIKTFP